MWQDDLPQHAIHPHDWMAYTAKPRPVEHDARCYHVCEARGSRCGVNSHLVQGMAAKTVSQFLHYCLQSGMVDEILLKSHAPADVDQIKQAIIDIADGLAASADYHRDILRATGGSEAQG